MLVSFIVLNIFSCLDIILNASVCQHAMEDQRTKMVRKNSSSSQVVINRGLINPADNGSISHIVLDDEAGASVQLYDQMEFEEGVMQQVDEAMAAADRAQIEKLRSQLVNIDADIK